MRPNPARSAFRSAAVIVCILPAMQVRAADEKPAQAIGTKIVAYCQSQLSQQVGNGQCSVLIEHALREVGARTRRPADAPGKDDYVWGDLVVIIEADGGSYKVSSGKPADIRPGDVIQYRDAKFVHREGRSIATTVIEHHTSVVKSTSNNGRTIRVFEQNTNGQLTVKESTLMLADLKAGWMRFYRPVAKSRE